MHVSSDVWLHDGELPEVLGATDPNRASLVVGPTIEPTNVTLYGERAVLRAWLQSALDQLLKLPSMGTCSTCGGEGDVPNYLVSGTEQRTCPSCLGAGVKERVW